MTSSMSRTVRTLLGVVGALGVASMLSSTNLQAAGCCVQCSCIQLCIDDDGCGNNSSILCIPATATSRVCNGTAVDDFCIDHCKES